MPVSLSSVIAATAQWLVRAYPSGGGALYTELAHAQARQAATVAAWLRYPTTIDAGLLNLVGPGGSERLDRLAGATGEDAVHGPEDDAWRSWVDEVVASWAACLLAEPDLAAAAVAAVSDSEHMSGLGREFRRLVAPDAHDQRAAALLRHPDLLDPVAGLHRPELLERLRAAGPPRAP